MRALKSHGDSADSEPPVQRQTRWRSTVQYIDEHRWPLLAWAALAVAVAGAWGFAKQLGNAGTGPADAVYRSFQLFVLEYAWDEAPTNFPLAVARLAAPVVTAFATAGALSAIISALTQRGAPLRGGHVVVCGLGRRGARFAQTHCKHRTVVVVERDGDRVERERGATRKIRVLQGDATDPRVLRRAGVHKAGTLFAATGDDGVNAHIAESARAVHAANAGGRRARSLEAWIHIVDPELKDLLEPALTQRPDDLDARLHNVYEAAARQMVASHAYPVSDNRRTILIVGVGALGRNLVVRIAEQHPRARFILVDKRAADKAEQLGALINHVSPGPDLVPLTEIKDITHYGHQQLLLKSIESDVFAAIYVCMENDGLSLKTALQIHARLQELGDTDVPVWFRVSSEDVGLAKLLPPGGGGEYARLQPFDILSGTCTMEAIATLRDAGSGGDPVHRATPGSA